MFIPLPTGNFKKKSEKRLEDLPASFGKEVRDDQETPSGNDLLLNARGT
jgi:hypothetical protein